MLNRVDMRSIARELTRARAAILRGWYRFFQFSFLTFNIGLEFLGGCGISKVSKLEFILGYQVVVSGSSLL